MKRSLHSLSHYRNLTCDMGELVPISCTEVLAGDTFQHVTSLLVRTNPLLAPVMHPVHAKVHHWFVPFRLIWDDWESFITGGEDGLDASTFPTITLNPSAGSLGDYLGLPTGTSIEVSALFFRAYALIYNEWYRDQQLQTEIDLDTTSGADSTTNTTMQSVNWEKDYFTTARPNEQLGSTVQLSLTGNAPVTGIGKSDQVYATGPLNMYETGASGTTSWAKYAGLGAGSGAYIEEDPNNAGYPGIYADLSGVSAISVNDLREAFALQKFAEWRNMYGGRYSEYLRALGVRPSDARLQRPEYLGGGKQTIQFSEVLQTSNDGTNGNVGDLYGHGISAMRTNKYRKFFEEHGVVLSLMNVKPKTMYMQGLPRQWSRRTKEDFWQKELEILGQQEVLNKEVYAAHSTPEGTFGYQDRFDEYRRVPSSVHGEFRTTLDHWHMARNLASDPALNSAFVTANPTNRIYSTTSTHQLLIMAQHKIAARRLVRKLAKPGSLV